MDNSGKFIAIISIITISILCFGLYQQNTDYNILVHKYNNLSDNYNVLAGNYDNITNKHNILLYNYTNLKQLQVRTLDRAAKYFNDYVSLKDNYNHLMKNYNVLYDREQIRTEVYSFNETEIDEMIKLIGRKAVYSSRDIIYRDVIYNLYSG